MERLFYLIIFISSQTLVFSQVINIPDSNLKLKLLLADVNSYHYAKNASNQWMKIDTNNDGQIQQSEALLVTKLYIYYEGNPSNIFINSLTGLEYFYNLEYIDCRDNPLNTINLLASLIYLKVILANSCSLSSVNLNGMNSLEALSVADNNLTQIDLSGLSNLKSLGCDINNISTIDVSNNPFLTSLTCRYNNLNSINIKNGINHDFNNLNGYYTDCWKIGNLNLSTICADASELTSVQNFLNGCGTAQTINITSNCGLGSDEFTANKVVLYPNPTNNIVTLHNDEGFFTTVVIYNYLGQELKQLSIIDEIVEIDLSNFTNGIYFINLLGEKNEVVKIIKQ
ncbi:T9SS type A sorting domain-containing protein [Flavobacterium sp.]|uniref:T9SS type A sorting domain-containing protein n=1 Tax=Flavobacterium sp. TaxID=239 RepID=UPI0026184136|nr:T9SS type A sorting domain-containing protein [Flavobacterium sp.]